MFYKAITEEEKEFVELYNKWHSSYIFSAFGSADPRSKKYYDALVKWCTDNKEKAFNYIREILLEEPNDIVRVLQDVYGEEYKVEVNGYMPLDAYCNLWLNITDSNFDDSKKNIKLKDYYKDYNKWKKYLDKHYMSWRPNLENDPNITLEEFKEGKRNKESNRSWHDFPLSILKDEELEKLYKEGHLGDMTKYIQELHFFYNQVEEEIKRRGLKK